MDHRIRLSKNGPTHRRFKPKDGDIESGAVKCGADISCREVVGSSLWLSKGARPDISFAVNQVTKY